MQLLKLHGKDDPRIETWFQRKTDKYMYLIIYKMNCLKLWPFQYLEESLVV